MYTHVFHVLCGPSWGILLQNILKGRFRKGTTTVTKCVFYMQNCKTQLVYISDVDVQSATYEWLVLKNTEYFKGKYNF